TAEWSTRSTQSRPVRLSSSYLTFEPLGISTIARKCRSTWSPSSTSCHGCIAQPMIPCDGDGVTLHVRHSRGAAGALQALGVWGHFGAYDDRDRGAPRLPPGRS